VVIVVIVSKFVVVVDIDVGMFVIVPVVLTENEVRVGISRSNAEVTTREFMMEGIRFESERSGNEVGSCEFCKTAVVICNCDDICFN